MDNIVSNGVEYGLYALAVRLPGLFEEAEQFTGGMLASDPRALARVRALVEGTQSEKALGDL